MAISKDNVRTNITIPKQLKRDLEEFAKLDHRSFNNMVITILQNYVNGEYSEGIKD